MTNGVSSIPLETPNKKLSPYIELCILLPADWNLDEWGKTENFWPIEILKLMGRYPYENKTWLGWGHSVPLGKSFDETGFNGIIVLKSMTLPKKFQTIKYKIRSPIELYTIVPLYIEELNYKIENGTDELLKLFDKENICYSGDFNMAFSSIYYKEGYPKKEVLKIKM